MNVSTATFEFAHGRKPRGTGSWAFYFDGDDSLDAMFWASPYGTYSAAKRQAVAEAKRRGASSVAVAS